MTTQTNTQLTTTPDSLTVKAQTTGLELRHIRQDSLDLYEVCDAVGEFLYLSLTEQFDHSTRWRSRSEAEQDAMMTLALDEYYGELTWDDEIINSANGTASGISVVAALE